ncbi:sigma factor-like helix-turn-helix DNA-binding protein [Streptomyces sp. NPDC047928]|uniref:sigma factor-like helix-turn-helix DNA-binding protein n=1 Tax=unclassified Streptomyces TaxID=2593676 RepID=UPI003720666C
MASHGEGGRAAGSDRAYQGDRTPHREHARAYQGDRTPHREHARASGRAHVREFEAFVAGTGGRLLHAATLLTTEPARPPGANPRAQRLLVAALAATYAHWYARNADDPYAMARRELAARFARSAWRHHRGRGGPLSRLPPRERLIVVLRLYEGLPDEHVGALLGLPPDRVRALCTRAVSTLRSAPARPAPPTAPAARTVTP